MKRLLIIALVFVMLLSCVSCSVKAKELQVAEIKAICELGTTKCFYNGVAKIKKDKDNIFQVDRDMWIEYEGQAVYGYDTDQIEMKVVENEVTVKLGSPKLLYCSINDDSFKYFTSKDGGLSKNKITTEIQQEAVAKCDKEMKDKAKKNKNALSMAESTAKELIQNYVEKIGEAANVDYVIEWK